MKNIGITLFAVIMLAGCGDGDKTKSTDTTTTTADTTATVTAPVEPATHPGLDLAAKSDCFTCHKLNETSTGPSYAAVAAKYKSQMPAIADTLVNKIIKGGTGNWGSVPMTPHPTISKEDAKTMVSYIMTIQ